MDLIRENLNVTLHLFQRETVFSKIFAFKDFFSLSTVILNYRQGLERYTKMLIVASGYSKLWDCSLFFSLGFLIFFLNFGVYLFWKDYEIYQYKIKWLGLVEEQANSDEVPRNISPEFFVVEWNLELPTTQQPVSWGTRSWGSKESDFIWRARKPRRWPTSFLKNHLEKTQNSGVFYVRGGGIWSLEVMNNHHLRQRCAGRWFQQFRGSGSDSVMTAYPCAGLSSRVWPTCYGTSRLEQGSVRTTDYLTDSKIFTTLNVFVFLSFPFIPLLLV